MAAETVVVAVSGVVEPLMAWCMVVETVGGKERLKQKKENAATRLNGKVSWVI